MAIYERLMGEYGDLTEGSISGAMASREELVQWGEARGRAQGLALALAVLRNPNAPDIDGIREEVVERWEVVESGPAGS